MLFASPAPAAFAGLGAPQPRYSVERPSTEEQYFLALAKEHERAATLARQRMEEARRRQQQQRELEAQLRLQQELATVLQFRTPQRSPYHTPTRASFGRTLPLADDVIFGFDAGDNDAFDAYAERMHRRSRAAMIERQKRAEQQDLLRALFQEQRHAEAERVAELQRQRAQEVKAEQERRRKAQEEAEKERARRHLASRAADEEKLRQFFEALVGAMGVASSEPQGADLERQNAIRRNSAPSQEKETPAPATRAPERPASSIPAKRPASPTPSVASDASDASLNSIALLQDKYNTLRSSFSFPTTLAFAAPSSSTPGSSPILLYSPTNAPIHAYENALTNLLTELDAVESFGDAHVRDVRRSLVKDVEAELEALEERKREAWREQQIVVESPAPVESVPVVVESAPVEPASVVEPTLVLESAPVVESAPVESVVPAAESESTEPTSAIDSPIRLAWLATRLSQPSESEDDEVKVVRENLLARLTEAAPEITLTEPATEPKAEPAPEAAPTETEPAAKETELLSPDAVESPSEPEAVPFESVSEPALESLTVESVPEPEVVDAHSSTPLTEAPVIEAPAAEVPTTETATTEPETVGESTPATEPEVTLTTLVESVPESDATSVTTSSEPEVVAQHEAQSEPETESPVLAQPESESPAQSPEPFSVPAPAPAPAHHEHSTFVQVFPESDSDVDTDADLASELADRRSVNGEEFELL